MKIIKNAVEKDNVLRGIETQSDIACPDPKSLNLSMYYDLLMKAALADDRAKNCTANLTQTVCNLQRGPGRGKGGRGGR